MIPHAAGSPNSSGAVAERRAGLYATRVSQTGRHRAPLLLAGVAVLILVSLVVLLSLRGREEPAPRVAPPAPAAPLPAAPAATAPGQRPAARAPVAAQPSARPAPTAAAEPAPAAPDARPVPPAVHTSAPAAVPPEVENEPDPARRAELMKMHKLATARVRVSTLRHRQRLLRDSLALGRQDGSWSQGKREEAERTLRELDGAIRESEGELERVRTEVGGDIDKEPAQR